MTLKAHDLMPMFTVTNNLDGAITHYRDLWQRKNLLLVSIPAADSTGQQYVEALFARAGEIRPEDVQILVTSDAISEMPSPGVAVVDRWGEIYFVQGARQAAANLPAGDELIEWIRHVQMECPECEGERR